MTLNVCLVSIFSSEEFIELVGLSVVLIFTLGLSNVLCTKVLYRCFDYFTL